MAAEFQMFNGNDGHFLSIDPSVHMPLKIHRKVKNYTIKVVMSIILILYYCYRLTYLFFKHTFILLIFIFQLLPLYVGVQYFNYEMLLS